MSHPLAFAAGLGVGGVSVRWQDQRSRRRTERLAAATLETLLNAIDANDAQTGAHVRRVATYSLVLAEAADLDDQLRHSVERIALFHDIGKIHAALFDIMHESEKLSTEEREMVCTHPLRGAEVLQPLSPFFPALCEGVLSHHERWDGTGYPRGLAGEQIILQARIVSIADAFDAMTHRRRYRSGRTLPEATEAIAEGRGTQFDPDLADLFLSPPVLDQIREAMRQCYAPKVIRGNRRGEARKEFVANIPFRWRTESAVYPTPERDATAASESPSGAPRRSVEQVPTPPPPSQA